jgi:protein-arginine kinase activator protein McsA
MDEKQRPTCAKCNDRKAEISYAAMNDCRISFIPLCKGCFSGMRESFKTDTKNITDWLKNIMEKNSVSYDDIEYASRNGFEDISALSPRLNNLNARSSYGALPQFVQKSIVNDELNKELEVIIEPEHVFSLAALSCRCRNCGIPLDKFMRQEMQGCSFCFFEFREEIIQYLNSLEEKRKSFSQKKPRKKKLSSDDIIRKLEKDKNEAIEHRDYSLAVKIRDEINKIKNGKVDDETLQ